MKENILIVDDEPDIRDVISAILNDEGDGIISTIDLGGSNSKSECRFFALVSSRVTIDKVVVEEAQKTINFVSQKEILYDINTEFYHVKLTLDFEEMRVIEQSSLRKEKKKTTKFENNTYECQSLGVTVPEIDTSESTTPIGEKNL